MNLNTAFKMLPAIALTLVVGVGASPAAASSIGVNFHGGTPGIAPAESAGYVSSLNWNNFAGGGGSGLALLDDTGAATGVTLSFGLPGIAPANNLPTSGSAGDNKLMFDGLQSIASGTASYGRGVPQVMFEGLNSYFTSGYDVYLYFGDVFYDFQYGTGTVYETEDTAEFSFDPSTPITYPTGNESDSSAFTIVEGSAFDGTWIEGQNYVKFSGRSADAVLYAVYMNTGGPAGFQVSALNGLQIVGAATVPEPSTLALAGIGLVGLVGFALRRRR